MADLLQIATKRREELKTEIEQLENFIRFGQTLSSRTSGEVAPNGSAAKTENIFDATGDDPSPNVKSFGSRAAGST